MVDGLEAGAFRVTLGCSREEERVSGILNPVTSISALCKLRPAPLSLGNVTT